MGSTRSTDRRRSRAGPEVGPTIRILLLSAGLAAVSGIAIAGGVLRGGPPGSELTLPWWTIGLMSIGAELLVFDIEINHEAHTFTFSEVPMVLGLCLASPLGLVAGRLSGSALTLVGYEHQRWTKVLFNLSMYLAECCLGIAIFNAIAGGEPVTHPKVWLATAVGVLAADALSIACVAFAIHWHGAEPKPLQLLVAGSVTASANTCLGLVAVLLLSTSIAAVALLGVIAAVLILAYRAYASLARRHESLQLFYDYTKAISASMRAGSAFEAMLAKTREVLRSDTAIILLHGEEPAHPVVRVASRGDEPVRTTTTTALLEDPWVVARVIDGAEVLVLPRETDDPKVRDALATLGVRDAMVSALRGDTGVLGVVIVGDRIGEVSTYDAESARLLEILSSHTAVSLENGRLIDELNREVAEREYQAEHDSLTGLPNRLLFFERVNQRITTDERPFSVLLMDLDGFKEINDTLGHESGDRVLEEVARRLTACIPHDATIARLGGDEFALLLPSVGSDRAALAAANRLNDILEQPIHVRGVTLQTGSSIGIALWPEHARDGSSLLKCADVAMYSAKTSARRAECYDASRDEHSLERLSLGVELRDAISCRELVVHYQPKARLHDGLVIGAEALVRWHHPVRGMIAPDEFIAIAERTGSIGALTALVLRTALEQCSEWHRRGHELNVAVNISAASLLDAELPSQVEHALRVARARPEWLTLEITESSILEPRHGTVALEQLAATGVRIAIDDFGTGYSSLSYLARLPVHELKVDRTFVQPMTTDASSANIVRTIIDLAAGLGLSVVAEGIEDHLTWSSLLAAGCDVGQGYYLSRPIAADAFDAYLEETATASTRRGINA